ncbi:sphingosine-1-phosphate lyase, putative, partial [Ichthyophthirius multifiliis]
NFFIYKDKIIIVRQIPLKSHIIRFSIKHIPLVRNKFKESIKQIQDSYSKVLDAVTTNKCFKLPNRGIKLNQIKKRLVEWVERDEKLSGTGQISGSRYLDDIKFENQVKEFSSKNIRKIQIQKSIFLKIEDFSYHNCQYNDFSPSVRQMEAELIKITCSLFGSDDGYGIMTGGGTESLLLSVLAHRNYALKYKNITKPNLIIPVTAHPGVVKACKYFNVECIKLPVDENDQISLNQLQKTINKNTIMLLGSFPNFPHGNIDPIQEMAQIAKQKDIGMHVDCCLGGFVAAFAKDSGLQLPPFDFTVEGVTSISCDHHKYGLTPKGVSIIMFKNNLLRQFCYTSVSDWPGGLYAVPSISGYRTGTQISGAWYVMMVTGKEGYINNSKHIWQAVQDIVNYIKTTPELQELDVIGNPQICAIGIIYKAGTGRNIYHLEGAMSKKGWHLSGGQLPPAIQISINNGIANRTKQFCKDLKKSVIEVQENPDQFKNSSSASMYGASVKVPDQNLLEFVLDIVVDCFLKL